MARHEPVILVPLDGSKNAENALPLAAMLASVYDAHLHVVHVVEPEHDAATLASATDAFARYGERLVGDYALPRERCRFQCFQGSPAKTILALAEQSAWVVLASHGRGGFRATFIGSVADKMVRGSPVPVLLVPGIGRPAGPPVTVLIALDGSAEAEHGLHTARRIAAAQGARVVLLRAYSVLLTPGSELAYFPPELPEMLIDDATSYLATVAQPGEETQVVRGDAATAIVEVSRALDAGLVVMTASGKGLAGRLALGSTTDRVMHSLHRPLVIMPPPA